MADLIQTAVTILQRGQQLYPFDGLQGFPQAYPMLVTGDAQSNCARGSKVRPRWMGTAAGFDEVTSPASS